ncbi:hypothetical protein K439DRAFT_1638859 [Ramaria rubella]|nr:hypothetical protein K439DRAFT_1638859 [Ramaria rubella]
MFATQQLLSLHKGDGASITGVTANTSRLGNATLNHGFTAANLVDELAIGIIIIGLGSSPDEHQLKHTLTHVGINTVDKVLEELQKAENLARSSNIANTLNPEALAAMAKRTASHSTQFFCTQHPLTTTHNTVNCRTLKAQKKGNDDSKKTKENKGKKDKHKQKVNAADESDPESGSSDEERVMLAHAA